MLGLEFSALKKLENWDVLKTSWIAKIPNKEQKLNETTKMSLLRKNKLLEDLPTARLRIFLTMIVKEETESAKGMLSWRDLWVPNKYRIWSEFLVKDLILWIKLESSWGKSMKRRRIIMDQGWWELQLY